MHFGYHHRPYSHVVSLSGEGKIAPNSNFANLIAYTSRTYGNLRNVTKHQHINISINLFTNVKGNDKNVKIDFCSSSSNDKIYTVYMTKQPYWSYYLAGLSFVHFSTFFLYLHLRECIVNNDRR